MTRRELLEYAGNELGDRSENFRDRVLSPALDLVLADLALHDCLPRLVRRAAFKLAADVDSYDLGRIVAPLTGTTAIPRTIIEATIYAWGPSGYLSILQHEDMRRRKLQSNVPGRPFAVTVLGNDLLLDRKPTEKEAGTEVELIFLAEPSQAKLEEDVPEIRREYAPVIVNGIVGRSALFDEDMQTEAMRRWPMYEEGRLELFAETHNKRVGHIRPSAD